MKSIFLGGSAIALGLVSAAASAQIGASANSAASLEVGSQVADADRGSPVTVNQPAQQAVDLKRATRKSRRDVAIGSEINGPNDGTAKVRSGSASKPGNEN